MGRIIFFYLRRGVGAILFLLFGCGGEIDTVNIMLEADKMPVESVKNVEIIYSDSGFVKMKIAGPEMYKYEDQNPYIELPKGVRVEFYDRQKKVESELSANYAIRYEKEGRMEARHNVLVVNDRGETLNTEHLIWDERQKKIYTNKFVKITTAKEIIFGEGFESNENFTKYKILKPQGTIDIKLEDEENG